MLVCWLGAGQSAWAAEPEVIGLRVERADDGLYLSAGFRFELTQMVQEALLKGVPISFVSEAWVARDRWYWYDKEVARASRVMRLAYQPLTRRWRVSVLTNGATENMGLGGALSQNFDTLDDAMAVIRRIARWKIAELQDIEPDERHRVELRFQLDITQLPRPMQFGIATSPDWNLSVTRRLRLEPVR
jgi:hypothetical protein